MGMWVLFLIAVVAVIILVVDGPDIYDEEDDG